MFQVVRFYDKCPKFILYFFLINACDSCDAAVGTINLVEKAADVGVAQVVGADSGNKAVGSA